MDITNFKYTLEEVEDVLSEINSIVNSIYFTDKQKVDQISDMCSEYFNALAALQEEN